MNSDFRRLILHYANINHEKKKAVTYIIVLNEGKSQEAHQMLSPPVTPTGQTCNSSSSLSRLIQKVVC